MSNIETDKAYEQIWDEIDEHIDNYFRDNGTDATDNELVYYIFGDQELWKIIKNRIAANKLGTKIANAVFEALPDGPEREDYGEDR